MKDIDISISILSLILIRYIKLFYMYLSSRIQKSGTNLFTLYKSGDHI